MKRRIFNAVAAVNAGLLLGCPVRNLLNLRMCFGVPDVIMDVPARQLHLEAGLILLQVCLAALGGLALYLGAQVKPVLRFAAGLAWILVTVGGFAWDKALGQFVAETLPANSAFGCVLDSGSAHTHSILTNAPLVFAVPLALWVFWELRPDRGGTRTTK